MEDGFTYFKQRILNLTGIDLNSYKERQIRRRLKSLMQGLGIEDFTQYYRLIERDPERKEEFLRRVTINVSEFFRNPEQFSKMIQEHLYPPVREKGRVKVWSAGASTGEEPYSVGISLLELNPNYGGKILATDIDREALEFAQEGVYPAKRLRNVRKRDLDKYFSPLEGDKFRIKDQVKRLVDFRQHDLLRDPFEGGFDLIICRNVVIYFTEEAKKTLYEKFYKALAPGGVFFTGATEQIFESRKLGFVSLAPFFYQKPWDARRVTG